MGLLDRAVTRKLQHFLALWGYPGETALISDYGSGTFRYPGVSLDSHLRRTAMHVSDTALYFARVDGPASDQMAIRIPFTDVAHAESRGGGAWFAVQTYKGTVVIMDFGRHSRGAADVVMNQLDALQRVFETRLGAEQRVTREAGRQEDEEPPPYLRPFSDASLEDEWVER